MSTARLARRFRVEKLNPLGLAGVTGDKLEEALHQLLDDAVSETINTPQTEEFIEAVRVEVAHQRERWGESSDRFKSPPDWYWLVGYLAGKALHFPEKRLHHIVSSAAALFHWHAAAKAEGGEDAA